MAIVRRMACLRHKQLDGTDVFLMDGQAKAGTPQELLVVCSPKQIIRPHTHQVDAEMFIVSGSARVLSADLSVNGIIVKPGDVVFFEKNVLHGFAALDDGLVFVSRNGGIADEAGNWDIYFDEQGRVAGNSQERIGYDDVQCP